MKILQFYNNYLSGGGGETSVVRRTEQLLKDSGHEALTVTRDSHEIRTGVDKLSAFVNGIYSFKAKKDASRILCETRPNVAHIHNLYPLWSPSVLTACHDLKIPVVMTVHNHGLTCPIALRFRDSEICSLCSLGNGFHCSANNCTGNKIKSFGYALRFTVANKLRLFHQNVDVFIAISEFMQEDLIKAGYPAHKIVCVPHGVRLPARTAKLDDQGYVAFIGRISPEKGIDAILEAAHLLPHISFKIAGHGKDLSSYKAKASPNVTFTGELSGTTLEEFYYSARMVVIPSVLEEPFGLTAIEAMSYGVPVIAANAGGLGRVVKDQQNGLLFEARNVFSFAARVSTLWNDVNFCRILGENGRTTAVQSYSESVYLTNLLAAYEKAVARVTSDSRFRVMGQ